MASPRDEVVHLCRAANRRLAVEAKDPARRGRSDKTVGLRGAALVPTADGAPALSLRDAKGVERISLAVAPDGRPSLTVSDAFSHPRVRIALARESSLNFYDRRGKLRAVLGVSEYGPHWAPPSAVEAAPESESEAAIAFF